MIVSSWNGPTMAHLQVGRAGAVIKAQVHQGEGSQPAERLRVDIQDRVGDNRARWSPGSTSLRPTQGSQWRGRRHD